jgi:Outer membrane protein beta-barrel family/CarboxypepD_reg-like domain/TonB-dependent Receptor Plug Domain
MRLSLSILFLLITSLLFAQRGNSGDNVGPKVSVTGKVVEKDTNQPLEYATVAFIDKNGQIIEGGITDAKGNYNIKVPTGVYTIQFEFISYKTISLPNQRIFKNTRLSTIALSLDSESLDEIVVRAETTEVQIRLDKKIYNIGKDLTTSGATIGDALNNVPSVTVDVDGTIALRGNENVQILINGRPSAIAGFGSTEALRQLPAESIDRVEVITSPSARYDAEGTAGILNIVLRKEKTQGLNGSVLTTIGEPFSLGLTGNINLRTNKFNLFNNSGYRYRKSPGNAIFENNFFSNNIENPLVIEEREYDRLSRRFNTNLGVEYFITERSSVTASAFMHLGADKDVVTNITDEFDAMNILNISRIRTETETEDDIGYQISLNYINRFDDKGHELATDLQFERDTETPNSFIIERNIFPITTILPSEEISEENDNTEYLAQLDYVRPIGENAQFEAGYRGKFEKKITDYILLEEVGTTGIFIKNDSISNLFTYKQNVQALYTQYGNKIGNFTFLLGIRMESTYLKGEVTGEDVTIDDDFNINFDKNLIGLFPTVNLVYELNDEENITFGYNRRINRPRHWFLNPFPSRSSEANIFQGNPGLDPAYASAFDLGYLKRWERITLTSSIYYQYETGAFTRIQEDTGELTSNGIPIIRSLPINLATNQRYGFEAGMLFNAAKWLRLNGSLNIFRFVTEGDFNGVDYGAEDTSWFSRLSAKVTLPAKIEWQTNAFYRGPRNNSQTESKGIFSINLAISKDFLKDNATIGISVSDLLNSRKRKSVTLTDTFRSYSEFQWRERQINFNFTYRFNQKKQRQPNGREQGFGEEGGFGG